MPGEERHDCQVFGPDYWKELYEQSQSYHIKYLAAKRMGLSKDELFKLAYGYVDVLAEQLEANVTEVPAWYPCRTKAKLADEPVRMKALEDLILLHKETRCGHVWRLIAITYKFNVCTAVNRRAGEFLGYGPLRLFFHECFFRDKCNPLVKKR